MRFNIFHRVSMLVAVAALVGCAQAPKPLYMWEAFPRQQYEMLLRSGVSPESQIQALEAQMSKARSENSALPPGFRAHLGMLYLAVGNPDSARDMWRSEISVFPESAPFIESLIKRLDDQQKSDISKKQNPS